MKETMKKFGAWLLAASLALVGVSGIADVVQQPTQTADWFSAGFDGADAKWTIPTDAATFESGTLVIDTGHQEVVYEPAVIGKASDKVTVKTTVEMTPVKALPDASSLSDAQAAFTLLKDGEGLAYYGLAKVDAAAQWVKLTGVEPVEDDSMTVTVEIDYSAKTVTYKVGETALSDGEKTALPLADATKSAVSSIAYTGSGVASLLVGDYLDADRKFAVANAQTVGGYDYYATELDAQSAAGEGGAYLAFNSTGGGWDNKTAPLFVAEVFGSEGASKGKAASLTAAVGMAAAGDVIKVIRAVSDETVTVDKSVTITSDLATKPVLNNVNISGSGAEVELVISGVEFAGASMIYCGNAKALTVSNVEAHVCPSMAANSAYTGSRASFICLSRNEAASLLLKVKDCVIDSANGSADHYSCALVGWRPLANGSEISGNTFGTAANPYHWIATKTMDADAGSVVTLKNNTVYGTNHYYVFQAFDFYQNNSRANTYTILSENNVINVAIDNESNTVLAFEIECNTLGKDGHCILFDNGTTLNGTAITFNDIEESWNDGKSVVVRGETLRAAVCYGINAEFDANGKLTAGLVSDNVPELFAEGYEAVAQGTTPETWAVQEKANPVTICVSSEGGDDDGDGTAEKPFATLAKAVATAKSGDTVKLLTDLTGDFALGEAKDLSFDLGDKTLTGSVTVSAGSLVLSGAGTITGTVTGATVADGFLMSKYQQDNTATSSEWDYTTPVIRVLAQDDVAVRVTGEGKEEVYYFKSLGEASRSYVRGGQPYVDNQSKVITITMLKDNHGGGLAFKQKDTTVTVDFGGFTYTVDSDQLAGSEGTTTQAAQILKRITMTFKNGTLVADHPQIKDMIRSYAANMTFDNMVIDGTKMTDPRMTVVCLNGEMHLKNGTKVLAAANTPALTASYYVINATEYKSGLLYIDDNTVEISGPLTYDRDSGTIATMLETVKHIKPADYPFELVVPDECEWVDYTEGKKFLDYKKVAQITVSDVTTKYYALEDAVAAAGEDDVTIVVIGDTTKLTPPEGWEFKTDSETGITTLVKKAAYVAEIFVGDESKGKYETLDAAIKAAAAMDQEDQKDIELQSCEITESIKLPATLKNVTFYGHQTDSKYDGTSVLKNMTINSSDGNAYTYESVAFIGVVFDNSRIVVTGGRTGTEVNNDWYFARNTFRNLTQDGYSYLHFASLGLGEPAVNFTFEYNTVDGSTYASAAALNISSVSGEVLINCNEVSNLLYRPFNIQIDNNDGIDDTVEFVNNTFTANGRDIQVLTRVADEQDNVCIGIVENIFNGGNAEAFAVSDSTGAAKIDLTHNYYAPTVTTVEYNDASIEVRNEAVAADLPHTGYDYLEYMGEPPECFSYYTGLTEDGEIDPDTLVEVKKAVAQIVETGAKYSTFADAVQAVADGQTIKLLDDLTITASEVGSSSRIRAKVNYTLLGEGHKITLEPSEDDFYYLDKADAVIVFDNVRIVADKDHSYLALHSGKLTNHSLIDAAQLYTMTGIVSVDATSCMIDRTHEFQMNSTLIFEGDVEFDPAATTQAEKNGAAQTYTKTLDIRDNKTLALTNANITIEQRFQSNDVKTGADLFASNSLIEIGRSVENVSEGFPIGTWCPNAIANGRGDLMFTAKQRAELTDCVLRGAKDFNNAGLFVAKNTFIEFGNDFNNTGDLTLDGSELLVGTDFTGPASSMYTGRFINNGTIFLKNGSTISFANQGTSSGRMVIQGSTLEYADVNIGADEEIALDAASKITFTGTWSNAGAVSFDMTDATEDLYLLVENKGEAVVDDYGVTLTGEGYELQIIDGNLCAVKTVESPYWSDHAAAAYSTPVDTDKKILTIATPEELALFAKEVNEQTNPYNDYTINITKDIDLSAYEWVSIIALDEGSPYYDALRNATIEGNGNTISGMTISASKSENAGNRQGFIGYYGDKLTIKNLTFDGANVTGRSQVGVVIGSLFRDTLIENVHVVNSVMDVKYYAGAIVGFTAGSANGKVTIKDCTCENVKVTEYYDGEYSGIMVGLVNKGDSASFENSKIKNDCVIGYSNEFIGDSQNAACPPLSKMSEVDGWWYPTLADGIKAVEEDGEINLLANCAEEVTTDKTTGFTMKLADGVKFTGKVTGPDGYALKDNGDGTYTYGEVAADVCQIGETKYPSIAKALEAIGATEQKTGTIKMIDNSTMAGNFGVTIPAGYDVTLDLNGFRISNDAHEKSNSATIQIEQGAKLKIVDSDGDGVVANTVEPGTNGSWAGRNWWSNVIINYGTLVLDSGTVINTTEDLSYAVDSQRDATFIMNGGKLYSDKGDTAVRMVANSGSGLFKLGYNRFEMHGGEIVSGGLWLQQGDNPSEWPDICRNNGAEVIVDGGTINGFFDVQNMGSVTVDVSGGVINASKLRIRDSYLSEAKYFTISGGKISATTVDDQVTGGKLPVSITGGLFDETAKTGLEKYVAEGHAFVENTDPETSADYPWTVGEVVTEVAAVISADGTTTNKYATLQAAADAVQKGETIMMLANVTGLNEQVVVTNETITLDLNGKTISGTPAVEPVAEGTMKLRSVIRVEGGLTIVDSVGGGIVENTAEPVGGYVSKQYPAAVGVDGEINGKVGSIVINGGTFKGSSAFYVELGTVTVSNCMVDAQVGADSVSGALVIAGGSFDVVDAVVDAGSAGTIQITGGRFLISDEWGYVVNVGFTSFAEVAISGGVFSVEPDEDHAAEGYEVQPNVEPFTKDDYPWAVDKKAFVPADPETPITVDIKPAGEAPATTVPVTVSEEAVEKMVTAGIVEPAGEKATAAEVSEGLAKEQDNKQTVWQNYVMGIDGTNEKNVLATIGEKSADKPEEVVVVKTPIAEFNPPQNTGVTVTYNLLRKRPGETKFFVYQEGLLKPEFDVNTIELELGDTLWKFEAVFSAAKPK